MNTKNMNDQIQFNQIHFNNLDLSEYSISNSIEDKFTAYDIMRTKRSIMSNTLSDLFKDISKHHEFSDTSDSFEKIYDEKHDKTCSRIIIRIDEYFTKFCNNISGYYICYDGDRRYERNMSATLPFFTDYIKLDEYCYAFSTDNVMSLLAKLKMICSVTQIPLITLYFNKYGDIQFRSYNQTITLYKYNKQYNDGVNLLIDKYKLMIDTLSKMSEKLNNSENK